MTPTILLLTFASLVTANHQHKYRPPSVNQKFWKYQDLPRDETIGQFQREKSPYTELKFNHQEFKSENLTSYLKEEENYLNYEQIFSKKIALAEQNYKLVTLIQNANDNCDKSSTCMCLDRQIDYDLAPFRKENNAPEMDDYTLRELIRMRDQYKLSVYKIRNNKLFRSPRCFFPARCEGIEYHLLKTLVKANKTKNAMPDMDIFINTRDYPMVGKYFNEKRPLPIFSFSKEPNKNFDISYPAWTFHKGGPAVWPLYPNGLGNWKVIKNELDIYQEEQRPWSKKYNKVFFRGSRTDKERDTLVKLSRSRPDMVDAWYTKNQAFKGPIDTLYAEPRDPIHLKNHCDYKYLFNYKGVAASFRHKHLFMCKSLVFHVGGQVSNTNLHSKKDYRTNFSHMEDDWIEFYYPNMKPWIHYVPISLQENNDPAYLRALIDYFMRNQTVAKKIAENGYNYVKNHLTEKNLVCYWNKLLRSYSELIEWELLPLEEGYDVPITKAKTFESRYTDEL